jgi:fructoselysine-6-P-deglycase FrlB-like protein
MNSIESLKLDFNSQIETLNNIQNKKIFDDCIFVGSGDSYVAGLIVEYLTDHKCRCYSASDLFNSRFIKDKTYCFISVTGKTKANIDVARRASQAGIKTVAVTLNKNSKLANICDEVVPLKITRTNTPAAGFGTFVANVVTCLQLSGIKVPKKFDIWHKKAIDVSLILIKSLKLPDESLFILGNNIRYALALYTSFKMVEFFGTTAVAYRMEEFCHSQIFGTKKSHQLWILGQDEEPLSFTLGKLGLRISYFELHNTDVLRQLFQSIFFVQNLMLLLAQKYGFSQLQYLLKNDILKISSDMIYKNEN